MSDIMIPMPLEQLVKWIWTEYREQGSVFGVHCPHHMDQENTRTFLGRNLENPIGPAAGPHTQLAQNLIAAYMAGGRFFELKTVQIMDGKEMVACIAKPCIEALDEGYNVEWSTELYVPEALSEYIKAWFLISIIAKEFHLGSMDGFQFNMSVGYDLKGIQSSKIDSFIESLKDASQTETFKECQRYFLEYLKEFQHVTREDIEQISPYICNSVTLSTMHGCPAQEVEKIASYLIEEKGLHTFVKCNPTLLGYEYVRQTMDDMGYGYLAFNEFHFQEDLQYEDAVPMLQRLIETAKAKGLEFGVKLTNTFPVGIKQGELPGEEMYMSGKPLFLLSFALAEKLAKEFVGTLRMSFSGGADAYNIKDIVEVGIWPVTVATVLLKPGGYQRLTQLAQITESVNVRYEKVDFEKADQILNKALQDTYYKKKKKVVSLGKLQKQVSLMNCFMAPCEEECPIHQDVTAYMDLVKEEKYKEAFKVIIEKNPLPFITGTICYHRCMNKCMRHHYESAIEIRNAKLIAAQKGYPMYKESITQGKLVYKEKTAIIGGGPAGLAAAYFLSRNGMKVTIFEQRKQLGGALRFALPESKITGTVIDQDIEFIKADSPYMDYQLETTIDSVEKLKDQGFEYVIVATGAYTMDTSLKRHKGEFLQHNNIEIDEKNLAIVQEQSLESNQRKVYVIGDLLKGPSSVVEAIAHARQATDGILQNEINKRQGIELESNIIYKERGVIKEIPNIAEADTRCLHCASICEVCVEVCPNRANVGIQVKGMRTHQILHIDTMCNECGNCRSFCPYSSAPYLDKFTLFANKEDMENSSNNGFVVINEKNKECIVRINNTIINWSKSESSPMISEELQKVIETVCEQYSYLYVSSIESR